MEATDYDPDQHDACMYLCLYACVYVCLLLNFDLNVIYQSKIKWILSFIL